jgi:hypothetical protein
VQRKKLEGYVKVPPHYWPFVKYATHARYLEKTGEFRGGGFVLKNPFDTVVQGGGAPKRFIKMQNNFGRGAGHKEWIVAYEDIAHLYAKASGVELTIRDDVKDVVKKINENFETLAAHHKKLERRLEALEQRLARAPLR